MKNLRVKKAESLYQQEFTQLLYQEIKNPHLQSVEITRIEMTPDLRIARVYFFTESPQEAKEILKAFHQAKGYLKKEMALRISLRYTPDLEFHFDETYRAQQHLESLFQQLHHEQKEKTTS